MWIARSIIISKIKKKQREERIVWKKHWSSGCEKENLARKWPQEFCSEKSFSTKVWREAGDVCEGPSAAGWEPIFQKEVVCTLLLRQDWNSKRVFRETSVGVGEPFFVLLAGAPVFGECPIHGLVVQSWPNRYFENWVLSQTDSEKCNWGSWTSDLGFDN